MNLHSIVMYRPTEKSLNDYKYLVVYRYNGRIGVHEQKSPPLDQVKIEYVVVFYVH